MMRVLCRNVLQSSVGGGGVFSRDLQLLSLFHINLASVCPLLRPLRGYMGRVINWSNMLVGRSLMFSAHGCRMWICCG